MPGPSSNLSSVSPSSLELQNPGWGSLELQNPGCLATFQVKVSQTWTWQWPTWLGCPDYYNQFHMVDCGRVWDICVTLFDAKREHNGRCERPCVSPFSSAKHLFFWTKWTVNIFIHFYKNTQFWNTLNFCWDPTSHVYHSQLTKRYNFCLPYIKAKHLVAR